MKYSQFVVGVSGESAFLKWFFITSSGIAKRTDLINTCAQGRRWTDRLWPNNQEEPEAKKRHLIRRERSASVSEIMQYDVWKKLIKDKNAGGTANYWSHFVSLRQLMGVNISYILLYDLLVFKGAHPCLPKPHGTPRDMCRSVSSSVHCWGKTRPEGFHFKAKEPTPGHQERPHRTERKLLFSLNNSLPSCWVSRVNSPDQRTHWGLTQEVKGWTICQYPKICVFKKKRKNGIYPLKTETIWQLLDKLTFLIIHW